MRVAPVGVHSREHLFPPVSGAEPRVLREDLRLDHREVVFHTRLVQAEARVSRDHSALSAADTIGVNAGVTLAPVTCVANRDIFLTNVPDAKSWAERHLKLQCSFLVLAGLDQASVE